MSNIALQLERLFSGSIVAGSNVIFNSVVYSAGNIGYNSATGVITFNEAGRYVFNWFVATQTTPIASAMVFAVSTSQGDSLRGASPIKTGEIGGVGIVDVISAPVTASLINATANTIFLSMNTPLTASLVIIEDDIVTAGAIGPAVTADSMSAANTDAAVIAVALGGTDVPLPDNQNLNAFTANSTNTVFTVPATGQYMISYAVATTSALSVSSQVLKNGAPIAESVITPAVAVSNLFTSFIYPLAAGDTLTLQLLGLLGAATLLGGASTYLTVIRVI